MTLSEVIKQRIKEFEEVFILEPDIRKERIGVADLDSVNRLHSQSILKVLEAIREKLGAWQVVELERELTQSIEELKK